MKKEFRFTATPTENKEYEPSKRIIIDKQTGVNYLLVFDGFNGYAGLTVLVDADGKPIVTLE